MSTPDPYAYLSATDLTAQFRSRRVRPSEVIEHLLARIAEVDPSVNAITEVLTDLARTRAADADRRWAAGELAPLLGVPVVLKEKHDLAGRPVSQGVVELTDTPDRDHPIVERLLAAGAIPIARSAVPEFCAATVTDSRQWGVTRNPWNPACTPGGSSGGSGAALAAGFAPLATGSDIGGSTRIPACYCGVVGYKAPYGVVPGLHPSTMDWYRGDSAMARTVEDVRLMHNVIAGQHPRDQLSIPSRPVARPPRPGHLDGATVVLSRRLGDYPVEADTLANLEETAYALAAAGATIVERELPWHANEIMDLAFAHYGHILAPGMAEQISRSGAIVSPYITQFIEHALEAASRIGLPETFRRETIMRDQLSAVLSDADALIAPVSARSSLPAEAPTTSVGPDGRHYWQDQMAVPININNRCPALALPTGFGHHGVPTGLQIVGSPYDQEAVFRIGYAVEAHRPWAQITPADTTDEGKH
ncbi:amidase [Raineyella sp. LH-20]|uniref:amidase n=1 Tax=Raineyella sp. LH-20 TaxID=3081204 RepID=UPI0029538182|nr:amidase [Raineyella sp. LH-20]WOP19555.1 amidase [Raineyella sp. LH-20]